MIEQDRPAVAKVRKPRRWPLWLTVFTAALLAAGVAALVYDRRQDDAVWRAACAELDRTDPRWRWEQLVAARPSIPDDQNAALVVLRVADAIHGRWPDWGAALPIDRADADTEPDGRPLPTPGEASVAAGKRRVEEGEAVAKRFEWQVTNQRPRAADADALRAVLADAAPAARLAMTLDGLRTGRLPRPWSSPLMAHATTDGVKVQEVAQLLALRGWSLAAAGRGDEALACARAELTVARCAGNDGLADVDATLGIRFAAALIVQRALALTEPGGDALATTQARFAEEAARPLLPDALRWDRAVVEDTLRAYDEGRLGPDLRPRLASPPPAVTGKSWIDDRLHQLRGGFRKQDYARLLEEYTRWIERAAAGPDELWREREALQSSASNRLPRHLAGTAAWVFERDRHPAAIVRSAVVALAAERFRRASGHWPKSLDELVPQYLTAVPLDPYRLVPLGLAKEADGIALTWIGRGSRERYRLWDPAVRGAPPSDE